MNSRYLVLILLIAGSSSVCAQQVSDPLYESRDVKAAYQAGTRSRDGRPGKNYWQNRGRYDISISLDPPDRTVYGEENIAYFNNSPDTLKYVVIKLLDNIHKPGAARLQPVTSDYLTSGIHIDSLVVNDIHRPFTINPGTYFYLSLRTPLTPGDSAHFYFRWHYDLSVKSDREGMIDSTSFYVAYFYPRIAVYDDYFGWDDTEFNDRLEFYNDFNDYSLRVSVPANFLVWSTGTLLNAHQVLQPEYENRLKKSYGSDAIIHIAGPEDLERKKITAQNNINTWQWKADNVTDVAFGISDHYNWDATSVVVDDATGRRASAQAAYYDSAADFHQVARYARHSLDWFSHHWPGIPYPYEKTTVYQGFANMEYPMMVNDASTNDTIDSRLTTEHEISHTYMPFYMGINETRYGFMDEGWATTFELLIGRADVGREMADRIYRLFRVARWAYENIADVDLPIITPGTNLSTGLGINEYGKPSLGYLAMMDLLGDDLFKKCLQEYMDRWHGKHPIPWDFFYTFNDVSGKNLNWFWKNWFFSNNYIDYTLTGVSNIRDGYEVAIRNTGGMYAPFELVITYTDGSNEKLHQTPAVWKDGSKNISVKVKTKKKIRDARVVDGIFMDADPSDNTWGMN